MLNQAARQSMAQRMRAGMPQADAAVGATDHISDRALAVMG